jgi:hypothetical protein
VGNVVFVEIFAIVEGLEPELTERFALRVWAYDTVEADEAGEADAVKTLGVEDRGRVADAFCDVYMWSVPSTLIKNTTVKGKRLT